MFGILYRSRAEYLLGRQYVPTIGIEEAQSKLRELIASLGPNDEDIITDHDRPVARLVPEQVTGVARPKPGLCEGMVTIVSDDEEHLKDFQEYMP